MGYQSLEKLLPRAGGSIYKLIVMVAKRATELADGSPKLIDFPSSKKVTTIAFEEVEEGKVELKEVAVARALKEKKEKKEKE